MSEPNLAWIKDQLRQIDVLSGLHGAAAQANLTAICESLAINEVAGLVSQIEGLTIERDRYFDWADASRADVANQKVEIERLSTVLKAAQREKLRHLAEVDTHTDKMTAERKAYYRHAHVARCDLCGVLALVTHE